MMAAKTGQSRASSPRPMQFPGEEVLRAALARGETRDDIAARYNVHKDTVSGWLRRSGLHRKDFVPAEAAGPSGPRHPIITATTATGETISLPRISMHVAALAAKAERRVVHG